MKQLKNSAWLRCPQCGKEFNCLPEWVYNDIWWNSKRKFFCSYGCLTRYRKERDGAREKK